MIVELFILYQLIAIGFFITAFFTKQEIFWVISVVMNGLMMVLSYNIQKGETFYSHPELMAVNLIFFLLSILYGFHDILDKYGRKIIPFKFMKRF